MKFAFPLEDNIIERKGGGGGGGKSLYDKI
jgi:hypothetical protein